MSAFFILSYGTGLGPSRTRVFAAREKFLCARPTRKFIFRPHGKVIRATPHACGVAARKRHAQNVFASLGRPVTARINAHMIKYDNFVKIFIIMY